MATMAQMCANLPEHERPYVRELAAQALFMKRQLAQARRQLADEPLVVEYANGESQFGVKRNPAFDAYDALLKSYTATLRELREALERRQAPAGSARIVSVAGGSRFASRMAANG